MQPKRISVRREIHEGTGARGRFELGDAAECLDALLSTHAGQVKLIYLDPPYQTGSKFVMRVRVGAGEWKSGKGSLALESFSDTLCREEFLKMMRGVLEKCRLLLRDDGMIFIHIDYRTHPYLRLLGDEIFGEDNFLNEIIWAYQTGGRSLKHFSRKHDVILFYRRSANHDFNVDAVKVAPTEPKSNHMRRHVDPDGRVYRSVRVNGRVYTYYDDDPVAPTDVWQDLPHLQQKDPERTGYDTQKPLALLDRIVKCASREGEIVLDPFAGSSTTLAAAKRLKREFIGFDRCPMTLNIARKRFAGAPYELYYPEFAGEAICEVSVQPGVGFYHITLDAFRPEEGFCAREFDGLDAVDNWSAGYVREDTYHVMAESLRTKRTPKLAETLNVPAFSGRLAICVNDVAGRSFLYEIVE